MSVICCIFCGATGVNLPANHPCRCNLSEADLARVRAEAVTPRPEGRGYFSAVKERRRAAVPTRVVPTSESGGRLAGLLRVVSQASEGQRNASLFWAACRAGEAVTAGEVDAWRAAEELTRAGATCGLEAREIASTIRSGFTTSGVSL